MSDAPVRVLDPSRRNCPAGPSEKEIGPERGFLAGHQIAVPVDVEPGGFRRRKPRLIALCNCAEAVPSADCDAGHEMAGKAFNKVLAGGIVEPLVHERRGEGV
jgi:hypothetical protein